MNTAAKQVRDLALEDPSNVRVFERFGIDYCCGGRKSLAQACADLQLSLEQVTEKLAQSEQSQPQFAETWTTRALAELVEHIVADFHTPTRAELERLVPLSHIVAQRHGARLPDTVRIAALVSEMCDDMLPHMDREERILFPYIVQLEEARQADKPAPYAFFGTVGRPIAAMMSEHERVGEVLSELRLLTNSYVPAEDACTKHRVLLAALSDFERLTHRHVHLENNILFVRAAQMEERA